MSDPFSRNYNNIEYTQQVAMYNIDPNNAGVKIDQHYIRNAFISSFTITQDISIPIPVLTMRMSDLADADLHLYGDNGDSFVRLRLERHDANLNAANNAGDATVDPKLQIINIDFLITEYTVVGANEHILTAVCTNWFDLNNFMPYATGSESVKIIDAVAGLFDKANLKLTYDENDIIPTKISNVISTAKDTVYHTCMYMLGSALDDTYGPYYISYNIHGDSFRDYTLANLKRDWASISTNSFKACNVFRVDGDEGMSAQTRLAPNIAVNVKRLTPIQANAKLQLTNNLDVKTFDHLSRTWSSTLTNRDIFVESLPPIPKRESGINVRTIGDTGKLATDIINNTTILPTNNKFAYHDRVAKLFLQCNQVMFRTHGNITRAVGDLIILNFEDTTTALAQQLFGVWQLIKIEREFDGGTHADVIYATRVYHPKVNESTNDNINNITKAKKRG